MRSLTHNLFYFILVGDRLFLNTLNGLAPLFGSQAEDIHSSGKITRAETASRLRDATYQLSIGPAVDGKGNLYSLDGKKWETFSDDELDANVVLSIVISAEEGELPSSSVFSTSTFSEKPQPMRTGRLSFRKLAIASDAQEAELITAFPELTGYKVYQDTRELTTLPVSQRNYTVKNLATSTPLLQVTV